MPRLHHIALVLLLLLTAASPTTKPTSQPTDWLPLFPADGEPKGFHVTAWSDVAKPPPDSAKWLVKDGVLHGSTPRGTWLVSDDVYADFELELDFKIGPAGNSGVGLRFPDAGDPAFDGLELQIMGPRYRGDDAVPDNERTGALYQLFAPKIEPFREEDWNHYWITCKGSHIKIYLNGHQVQNLNLDDQKEAPKRGKPPADRPRTGHIGFQELSRGDTHVQIKNAKLRRL
ncbi:MAG: hypothetical protein JWN40_4067 [Phycisphaerales bacterium]|nr:hypothetical protein [Phycisphaerales bacterium]